MSRAFVKDDVDRPEEQIDIPVSDKPNLVTPSGLADLRRRLGEAEHAGDERQRRYLQQRLNTAVLVEPASQPRSRAEFGATVTVRDDASRLLRFTIVGEDEADPLGGRISHASPIAQALLGKKKGAAVIVTRPAGPIRYRIESIE